MPIFNFSWASLLDANPPVRYGIEWEKLEIGATWHLYKIYAESFRDGST